MIPFPFHGSTVGAVLRRRAQAGFSLVEISIVSAIILLVAMVAVPAVGSYIIENKVPKVGEELLRFAVRVRVGASAAGELPYIGLDNRLLANAMRDSGVLHVSGDGAANVVRHGLGGGARGTVSLMPASLGEAGQGSAFRLQLERVSHAACPALASILQQVAAVIRIDGQSGGGEVKNAAASPPQPYNPLLAGTYCSRGDVNTFVFTIQ